MTVYYLFMYNNRKRKRKKENQLTHLFIFHNNEDIKTYGDGTEDLFFGHIFWEVVLSLWCLWSKKVKVNFERKDIVFSFF